MIMLAIEDNPRGGATRRGLAIAVDRVDTRPTACALPGPEEDPGDRPRLSVPHKHRRHPPGALKLCSQVGSALLPRHRQIPAQPEHCTRVGIGAELEERALDRGREQDRTCLAALAEHGHLPGAVPLGKVPPAQAAQL